MIDGTFITSSPNEFGVRVPAIFGSNVLEGSIFVMYAFGAAATNLTQQDYYDFLDINFGSLAALVNETYSLALFDSSVFEAVAVVMTDYSFRCSARRGATVAAANGVPVYTYSFNHTPSCSWETELPQALLKTLGPTHSAEIPFVFGTVDNLPLPGGGCNFTSAEVAMSNALKDAWTSMAKHGKPGGSWSTFAPNTSLGVDVEDSVVPGVVDYSTCAFWDAIDAAIRKNGTTMGQL